MKFQRTSVMNFENAFRGLRNPLESWAKSDSEFGLSDVKNDKASLVASRYCTADGINVMEEDYDSREMHYRDQLHKNGILRIDGGTDLFEYAYLGPKDLDLAHRMIKAGSSDRKFLRQIFVSVDITAPLYWWKEFDTYKVGTVANSTSTMHKLASTPITKKCFELDDYNPDLNSTNDLEIELKTINLIDDLEQLRQLYNTTKDKKYWKELIRWLPNGWLQTRTVTLNYEILRNIYTQRRNHKLTEWHQFCDWIKTLPYAEDLIIYGI